MLLFPLFSPICVIGRREYDSETKQRGVYYSLRAPLSKIEGRLTESDNPRCFRIGEVDRLSPFGVYQK